MSKKLALTEVQAVELFKQDAIEGILSEIEQEVRSFIPDLETKNGRDAIASLARKVSSSKVTLFNAGKSLTKDWKAKAALVDKSKKMLSDRLDALRDEILEPLTKYRESEKLKNLDHELAIKIIQDHGDAINQNDLFDREKSIAEKERVAQEAEDARVKAQEKLAYEDKIKADAVLAEKKKQEDAVLKIKQDAEFQVSEAKRIEAETIAENEKLKREKIQSDLLAKENARIAKIKAEDDKKQAILKTKKDAGLEAKRKETLRLEDERKKKEEREWNAANLSHRKQVNNQAISCLLKELKWLDEAKAKEFLKVVIKFKIDNVSVNY